MSGVTDRFRGKVVLGESVPSNQLELLSSSPYANPTITNAGNSSVDGRMVTRIVMNKRLFNSTGTALARRGVMWYHLEDTAGALLANENITGATAAETSGNSAVGLVLPDSTTLFARGRVICSSTGGVSLALTSTGTSTARMFLTLANGTVVAGSTIVFT